MSDSKELKTRTNEELLQSMVENIPNLVQRPSDLVRFCSPTPNVNFGKKQTETVTIDIYKMLEELVWEFDISFQNLCLIYLQDIFVYDEKSEEKCNFIDLMKDMRAIHKAFEKALDQIEKSHNKNITGIFETLEERRTRLRREETDWDTQLPKVAQQVLEAINNPEIVEHHIYLDYFKYKGNLPSEGYVVPMMLELREAIGQEFKVKPMVGFSDGFIIECE